MSRLIRHTLLTVTYYTNCRSIECSLMRFVKPRQQQLQRQQCKVIQIKLNCTTMINYSINVNVLEMIIIRHHKNKNNYRKIEKMLFRSNNSNNNNNTIQVHPHILLQKGSKNKHITKRMQSKMINITVAASVVVIILMKKKNKSNKR